MTIIVFWRGEEKPLNATLSFFLRPSADIIAALEKALKDSAKAVARVILNSSSS